MGCEMKNYFLLFLALHLVHHGRARSVEDNELVNCTGSVIVRDRTGQEHSIAGNVTNLDIDAVKDDVVLVKGDCCYELFAGANGYGEHRLTLEDVTSVFKVGC